MDGKFGFIMDGKFGFIEEFCICTFLSVAREKYIESIAPISPNLKPRRGGGQVDDLKIHRKF